jgi:cytochrome c-type biogenesis protein CcmH/NrfF
VLLVSLVVSFALTLHPLQAQQSDRTQRIGRKFMCMCRGCNDTAATCFHVGGEFSGPCATAKAMLKKIDQHVARGEADDLIVQSFVQEYGQAVLIEPPHSGFGNVAWAMPTLYLLAGTIFVVLVIRRWRRREAPAPHVEGTTPLISAETLEQARRRVAEETRD